VKVRLWRRARLRRSGYGGARGAEERLRWCARRKGERSSGQRRRGPAVTEEGDLRRRGVAVAADGEGTVSTDGGAS
jgi:hypothetical protein